MPRRRKDLQPQLTEEQRRLVEENGGLIGFALKRYSRLAARLGDDCKGIAALALVEAVRRFDPAKGSFGTYAIRVIWAHMLRAAHRDHTVPRGWIVGTPPLPCVSLSSPVYMEGNYSTEPLLLADVIARDDAPRSSLEPDELAVVHRAITFLGPQEKEVLRLYFFDGKTNAEIAVILQICRERARQILESATERLRRLICINKDGAVRMARDSERGDT